MGQVQMEVYLYMQAEEAEIAVECGINLSEHADREILHRDGTKERCISTYMNPKDAIYIDDDRMKCVGINVDYKYCLIADRSLYEAGQEVPELMRLYYESVIQSDKYILGTYRVPECLITVSLIPGKVYFCKSMLNVPLITPRSEEYYPGIVAQRMAEEEALAEGANADSPLGWDMLLLRYFRDLAATGKMRMYELPSGTAVIFEDNKSKRSFVLKCIR